jgi:hypothetical protein
VLAALAALSVATAPAGAASDSTLTAAPPAADGWIVAYGDDKSMVAFHSRGVSGEGVAGHPERNPVRFKMLVVEAGRPSGRDYVLYDLTVDCSAETQRVTSETAYSASGAVLTTRSLANAPARPYQDIGVQSAARMACGGRRTWGQNLGDTAAAVARYRTDLASAAEARRLLATRPAVSFGAPVIAHPSPDYDRNLHCAYGAALAFVVMQLDPARAPNARDMDALSRKALAYTDAATPAGDTTLQEKLVVDRVRQLLAWLETVPESLRGDVLTLEYQKNLELCDRVHERTLRDGG